MLRIILIIFAISLVTLSMAELTENKMLKLLPNGIHEWKAHGKAETYYRETICDL